MPTVGRSGVQLRFHRAPVPPADGVPVTTVAGASIDDFRLAYGYMTGTHRSRERGVW
ncbi:hypothetical protein [Streptomyces sp. NPDC001876]|uniref:hypothetical protein n=1 Tax=Streptomyces sp. NPDC001876 TaxID=3154402 RepID=UPI0033342ED0